MGWELYSPESNKMTPGLISRTRAAAMFEGENRNPSSKADNVAPFCLNIDNSLKKCNKNAPRRFYTARPL
jgi:hypothetical protein